MKISKKVLAVLLTIATLIGIFSCATTVFAEEYNEYADNKAYQESLLTEAVETEKENAEIICEVPEKRDEFSKTEAIRGRFYDWTVNPCISRFFNLLKFKIRGGF